MMDDQRDSRNYVEPQKVDLNAVQVTNEDTMLNRERDNIVSATIQVNDSINEEQALKVNDSIKVKETNPFIKGLAILASICLAIISCYFALKLSSKIMTFDEPTTTTTTTTTVSAKTKVISYLNSTKLVRKFQSEKAILLFSPYGFDANGNTNFYMYIEYSDDGIVNSYSGTYRINRENVDLMHDDVVEYVNITEKGLEDENNTYEMYDSEMKYYTYETDRSKMLLMINGTMKNEKALFITSEKNSDTISELYNFTESETAITLENGNTFIKNGLNVTYNGIELELKY